MAEDIDELMGDDGEPRTTSDGFAESMPMPGGCGDPHLDCRASIALTVISNTTTTTDNVGVSGPSQKLRDAAEAYLLRYLGTEP